MLLAEPISLTRFFVIMFLVLIVSGVLWVPAAYFLLKYFAKTLNFRRDSWAETARELGLEIQMNNGLRIKPLKGTYLGCRVQISHEHVPKGKASYDSYTVCEAYLPAAINFPFEIKSENVIYQVLASPFRNKEVKVDIPGFDNSFFVDCDEEDTMRRLLGADLPGGRTPNLIADLLLIKKSFYQLRITDELVYLKNEGEFLEAADIKPMLNSALYLVKRIHSAREMIEKV
jgi:hypothetical protein